MKRPAPRAGRLAQVRAWLARRLTLPRVARIGSVVLGIGALLGAGFGGFWLWHSPWPARAGAAAVDGFFAATARAGFSVDEIYVVGRERTPPEALRDALGIDRGYPILAADLDAARRRIEAIGWVRSASVERRLPGTLMVRLEERAPFALWQNDGALALIDEGGTVITRTGLGRFGDLLMVVGRDAPAHAAAILDVLRTEPGLMGRVHAAVRVGGRRWNLKLDNGIQVQLPEKDPDKAWRWLAEVERNQRLLARDVRVVDLRLPDRVVLRAGQARKDGEGEET